MPTSIPFSFDWPTSAWIALALVAVTVVVVAVRRPGLPRLTYVAASIGLLALALAAAGVVWHRPLPGEVLVLVDLSPSTRTASYRDRATLQRRIDDLLGSTPRRVEAFADRTGPLPSGGPQLADLPSERTVFEPGDATAVLLFTDARFELPPWAPPTYVVVDPALDEPADAALTSLEIRVDTVAAHVRNTGGPRSLTWRGTRDDGEERVARGSLVLSRPVGPSVTEASARLSRGDAWPENDGLSIPDAPPASAERWWIGRSSRAGMNDWRHIEPANLPTSASSYLAPTVIALDNVTAAELGDPQSRRLHQYVRDLGGGLVILGGGRAFAAGGYVGSVLDSLSPLASTPPEPTTHWILLVDASGSMNADAGGGKTRWRFAADALAGVLPALPPDDLVSAAGFAGTVTWWARGLVARQASEKSIPPTDAAPRGPTNLRRALETVADSSEAAMPKQLLLMTDANAELGDATELSARLKAKDIRLHLLALADDGSALPQLREIVGATGGTLLTESTPGKWAAAIRELTRAAMPDLLNRHEVEVRFRDGLGAIPSRRVAPWNRTWTKPGAATLADADNAGERVPMAARWNLGEGQVAAAAFSVELSEVEALARLIARPPRDPRFRVTWETGPRLVVRVDAFDTGETRYLNGLELRLTLAPASSAGTGFGSALSHAIPQVAPGRYELAVDAPRTPMFAAVREGARVIDRVAIAGRYAPEFDAVGNDRRAMRELAARTGGAVIEPGQAGPINLPARRRPVRLSPYLAAAGAVLLAIGLIYWRLSR